MDQLWRDLKRLVAANQQAKSIDDLAAQAVRWVMKLTPRQARRKAGMSSPVGADLNLALPQSL